MANYTFPQKTPPPVPGPESNFGGAAVDGNHNFLIGMGNGFQTVDVSGTPNVSPVATSTTVTTTLTTPLNALSVTLIPLTNPINVSESDNTVTTRYFTIPVGVPTTIELARQSALYLRANGTAGTVSFYYNII